MILAIQHSNDVDYGLFQLIEKVAPVYLPVSRIPASQYQHGHTLASQLGMTPEQLLTLITTSRTIHAVILPTGSFYIHPVGLEKYLLKRFKKKFKKKLEKLIVN